MAEIRWLGHACFRIRGREAVVLTDPVGPASGYQIGPQQADIVTISHDQDPYGALDLVEPGYRVLTGPGEYEIRDVFIHGFRADRGAKGGARAGRTTVYLIELEELVIGHLGNLGHPLNAEQAAALSAVDVLLVPVGGGPVLNATQAVEVIGQLDPSIVIPMQYRTEAGDHERDPLDRFLKEVSAAGVTPVDRVTVRKADLGETVQVVVLQP